MSEAFIGHLWSLERGELATLRRGLAFEPGNHVPAFALVEGFVVKASNWERQMYYLVAGLFATVEQADPKRKSLSKPPSKPPSKPSSIELQHSLGLNMARLYITRNKAKSIESRFIGLLDADSEQLPHRLRQMIALLRDQGDIDWLQLLQDLRYWNQDNKSVQRHWAKDFYRPCASG
jgi:CRISPR system Cascade subunit CasB